LKNLGNDKGNALGINQLILQPEGLPDLAGISASSLKCFFHKPQKQEAFFVLIFSTKSSHTRPGRSEAEAWVLSKKTSSPERTA
jgi:hypothetical protein